MTTPRPAPFVWATWLHKLLAGVDLCEWATWFKAHHQFREQTPTVWNAKHRMEHTELRNKTVQRLEARGYKCTLEDANTFEVRGRETAIVLKGKPDLVATKNGSGYVVDTKTGERHDYDAIQVLIYMWGLKNGESRYHGMTLAGRVVYPDYEMKIAATDVDSAFVKKLGDLIRRVGGQESACRKTPTVQGCRFCKIPAGECHDRVKFVELPVVEADPW